MNADEIKELKDLIEFLQEKKIGEFRLEHGELKVELRFEAAMAAAAAASQAAPQIDALTLARLLQNTAPGLAAGQPSTAGAIEASGSGSAPSPGAAPTSEAASSDEGLHVVKSPIVGTFYESPSPGSPAFITIGDTVSVGQPLCIVEAMKLMNEIESDVAGEVVKRLVGNGQPVEYGQPLFAVRPR